MGIVDISNETVSLESNDKESYWKTLFRSTLGSSRGNNWPAAAVAGTVLTASSIVELSPWLKWSLAIIAGGGIAGTIHVFTGATRLTSTATTGGLANPAVSTAEAGGALGVSFLAIAAPILGVLLALLLVYLAARALSRRRLRR